MHAAVACLSSVSDEAKYLQEIGVRELKVVEIQHAGKHRESRLFRLQQVLCILASCCRFEALEQTRALTRQSEDPLLVSVERG